MRKFYQSFGSTGFKILLSAFLIFLVTASTAQPPCTANAGTLTGPSSICQGGTVNITHSASTGTLTFIVFQNEVAVASVGTVNEVGPFLTAASPGQYCVYAVAYLGLNADCGNIAGLTLAQIIDACLDEQCYSISDPLCVTVNNVNAGSLSGPSSICQGGTVNITHSASSGTLTFIVFQNGVAVASVGTVNEVGPFLTAAAYGEYCLYAVAYLGLNDDCGNIAGLTLAQIIDACLDEQCYDISEPLCITVNGSVITAPTVTQPTCATPTGTIVVNATGSGVLEYRLNTGDFQTSSTFSGLAPGDYAITVRPQSDPTCLATYSGNSVVLNAATGCTVPPTINCPDNIITTAASGQCSKSVSFSAIAAGTPTPTVEYKVGSTVITSPHTFPVGTTTVNCTATNIAGTESCSFTVTVEDNQPPVINTNPNPIVLLWSPNHKYQKITVSQCVSSVTDNCGSIPVSNVVITHVTSDEVEDAPGKGDGTTADDMKIAANCKSVDLRRERREGGNGRVYTIHLKVTDINGNVATATSKVVAPPNQSGVTAVDNGPVYTEFGPCYVASRSASPQLLTNDTEISVPLMVQNYPNPFTIITSIGYALPADANVSLEVYNQLGQRVALLAEGKMSAGYHQARFDATKLAAGIYLYRLITVDTKGKPVIITKKMIVTK